MKKDSAQKKQDFPKLCKVQTFGCKIFFEHCLSLGTIGFEEGAENISIVSVSGIKGEELICLMDPPESHSLKPSLTRTEPHSRLCLFPVSSSGWQSYTTDFCVSSHPVSRSFLFLSGT